MARAAHAVCSAHLQVGIFPLSGCSPEGGRYTNFSNSKNLYPLRSFEATLRAVLAAAGAQIHARPSRGTELDVQRRVKHLLQ